MNLPSMHAKYPFLKIIDFEKKNILIYILLTSINVTDFENFDFEKYSILKQLMKRKFMNLLNNRI